ncbi:hypothetical protein GCM10023339_81230 [Alloalcanivorax gelatiniphagus]
MDGALLMPAMAVELSASMTPADNRFVVIELRLIKADLSTLFCLFSYLYFSFLIMVPTVFV